MKKGLRCEETYGAAEKIKAFFFYFKISRDRHEIK